MSRCPHDWPGYALCPQCYPPERAETPQASPEPSELIDVLPEPHGFLLHRIVNDVPQTHRAAMLAEIKVYACACLRAAMDAQAKGSAQPDPPSGHPTSRSVQNPAAADGDEWVHEPFMCIAPVCGDTCDSCRCAISGQTVRDYALRYAWLRAQSHPWGGIWFSLGALDDRIDAAMKVKP